MRKSNLIFLVVFALTLGVLIYWAYPIIKERYFTNDDSSASQTDSQDESLPVEQSTSSTNVPGSGSETPTKKVEEVNQTVTPQKAFEHITTADCGNECSNFEPNTKNFEYCQEICGLASKTELPTNDCQNLSNLKKDYCLKDEAVAKKDFRLCDAISDTGVRQTCQNRITEDLLNQEPQE
ncbi:hypothetical protein EPO05_00640 [Patescibacteria group bacterium]|nr:MAG: hypothetical protein EPO05_00640 [Patescibacteria group bacterium]